LYYKLYNIFIIWPFNLLFSGSKHFLNWHAITLANTSSSSVSLKDLIFSVLFSKCDETTDVNLKKDSSILSFPGDVRLIFLLNLLGELSDVLGEELIDDVGDIDFWSSCDTVNCLLGETLEYVTGEAVLSFNNFGRSSGEVTSTSLLLNISGLCGDRKSSSLSNSEENKQNK